jgi:UDP-3-O-[3-hydroxymyristoyl] glucosamine N-acyltransferase
MTLNEISQLVQGDLAGDPECIIEGVGPIDTAKSGDISFAEKGQALKQLDQTNASAVIVPLGVTEAAIPIVRVDNPRIAFTTLLRHFHPMPKPPPGIHPSASIGDNCRLGEGVSIGAGTVVGHNVTLADGVVLHPLVAIGDGVSVGEQSVIYPQVSVLERCRIGRRVIIHAGTVIGSDGFGFVQQEGEHIKIPQTGIVQIDDDVEIGAANTIDRATFGKTWLQRGVKTDNQVHIAHNVVIGEHTLLIAQAGISGSTTIGRHAIIAGQAGISDHLTIGDGVIVGPQTGIGQSIPEGRIVSGGTTGIDHRTWLRLQRALPRLPDMQKQMREMKKRIAELEKKLASSVQETHMADKKQ